MYGSNRYIDRSHRSIDGTSWVFPGDLMVLTNIASSKLLRILIGFFVNACGRGPARLQHLLQQLITHPTNGIVLSYCEVRQHVVVANVTCNRVPVLIACPFELCGVAVTRAHVFRLDLIPTLVDTKPISRHDELRKDCVKWR